jgi:hypothetical protein
MYAQKKMPSESSTAFLSAYALGILILTALGIWRGYAFRHSAIPLPRI